MVLVFGGLAVTSRHYLDLGPAGSALRGEKSHENSRKQTKGDKLPVGFQNFKQLLKFSTVQIFRVKGGPATGVWMGLVNGKPIK